MADIEKVNINGTSYDIVDAVALETADSALDAAQAAKNAIPTKVSQLDNDRGYITQPTYDASEEAIVF